MNNTTFEPKCYKPSLPAIEFSIPRDAYSRLAPDVKRYFPENHFSVGYLISTITAKAQKAQKRRYLNGLLYLTPSTKLGLPRVNLCGAESDHCKIACLDDSGMLGFPSAQRAMAARTLFLIFHQQLFRDRLLAETQRLQAFSDRNALAFSLRLNGTSDRPWEARKYGRLIQTISNAFPRIALYDYTKHFRRATDRYRQYHGIDSYHLTFSYSGSNWTLCKKLLEQGTNVAVPFANTFPTHFRGYRVIDGDRDDLRFLDPAPCVVGLRYKAVRDGEGKTVRPVELRHFVKAA